jgi:hypothetical protein
MDRKVTRVKNEIGTSPILCLHKNVSGCSNIDHVYYLHCGLVAISSSDTSLASEACSFTDVRCTVPTCRVDARLSWETTIGLSAQVAFESVLPTSFPIPRFYTLSFPILRVHSNFVFTVARSILRNPSPRPSRPITELYTNRTSLHRVPEGSWFDTICGAI